MFSKFEMPESEALGLLAAVIILLIAFGSVLAMGLPIVTALFGLGTGVALTVLVSNVQSMPDFAPQLTAMIGLGVGIDYALFIVTRYREGLHAGMEPDDATAAAIDTSGRAVLFAGATVIISLLGLYLMGLAFVRGLATGAALGVLVDDGRAAVTLLPALLGFAGRRIEVTRYRGAIGMLVVTVGLPPRGAVRPGAFALRRHRRARSSSSSAARRSPRASRNEVPHRQVKPREEQLWYRWSRVIQHRPWPALRRRAWSCCWCSPSPCSRCAWASATPATSTRTRRPRRAYDLLAEGFGPGFNGPIIVTVAGDAVQDPARSTTFTETLRDTDGVAAATDAIPVSDDLALVQVYADSAPQDEATAQLVHRLRDDVVPDSPVSTRRSAASTRRRSTSPTTSATGCRTSSARC